MVREGPWVQLLSLSSRGPLIEPGPCFLPPRINLQHIIFKDDPIPYFSPTGEASSVVAVAGKGRCWADGFRHPDSCKRGSYTEKS